MLKNQSGFTLIEMMIVLLVISVLLFITIPNVTDQSDTINSKGCEAFVHMVEAQVEAFKIEHNMPPEDLAELVKEKYLDEEYQTCPNGTTISIDADGSVIENDKIP